MCKINKVISIYWCYEVGMLWILNTNLLIIILILTFHLANNNLKQLFFSYKLMPRISLSTIPKQYSEYEFKGDPPKSLFIYTAIISLIIWIYMTNQMNQSKCFHFWSWVHETKTWETRKLWHLIMRTCFIHIQLLWKIMRQMRDTSLLLIECGIAFTLQWLFFSCVLNKRMGWWHHK